MEVHKLPEATCSVALTAQEWQDIVLALDVTSGSYCKEWTASFMDDCKPGSQRGDRLRLLALIAQKAANSCWIENTELEIKR